MYTAGWSENVAPTIAVAVSKSMAVEALRISQGITVVASALTISVPQPVPIVVPQPVPVEPVEGVSLSVGSRFGFSHCTRVSLGFSFSLNWQMLEGSIVDRYLLNHKTLW